MLLFLLQALPHLLGVQSPLFAPEFVPLPIEIDERGCKFEAIDRGQFTPDIFLDVQTDDKQPVHKFVFELVHDGLYLGAANSIG